MWRQQLKHIPLVGRANRLLKARLQERRAARSLAAYRRKARQTRLVCLEGQALQAAVRSRLADRGRQRWPKPKGQLHIFLAYYVSNWEAILPRALAPFGRVRTFEWRSEGYDDRATDWLQQRDAMNAAMLEAFQEANRQSPVDAVVGYLSGYNTAPQTLQAMAQAGAAIFNFCWDDKLAFPGPRFGRRYASPAALAHVVDLNLTNAKESIIKYQSHAGLAMFWPEAAHPEVHRSYDIPFEFDVSFVGARYSWRPDFIAELHRHGVQVACFGKGWPNGPLSDEDMVRLYSRSRINLGFSGIGHSRRLMHLKGRDFEVPMSGGLYLTQDNPELSMVFDVGKEIVTYTDAEDCAASIRTLLAEPERAAAIRAAGQARCRRDHTYNARWRQAFSVAGLLDEQGPAVDDGESAWVAGQHLQATGSDA